MLDEILYAGEGGADIIDGSSIRSADKSFAAGTECRARNYSHMLADEQLFSEFFGGQTCRGYIREDVESAFRFECFQSHAGEAFVNKTAAAVVFGHHFFMCFSPWRMASNPAICAVIGAQIIVYWWILFMASITGSGASA